MLFKWPVAKQWEQTFVKGTEYIRENLSTDSIVYKQAESVHLWHILRSSIQAIRRARSSRGRAVIAAELATVESMLQQ